MIDVAILGGGPAGLTAALYSSRALLNTVVFEKGAVGGQIITTANIENYPGIPEIDGFGLIMNFKTQAEKFGAVIKSDSVVGLSLKDDNKTKLIKFTSGEEIEAKSVIIATGTRANTLNVPGEQKFIGHGLSFCATCDAAFYRDKEVAVIGGGDSAFEEAIFLTKFVKKVYLIHRRQGFRATKILQKRAKENPKIEFILDTVVTEFLGDSNLNALKLKNVKTGEEKEFKIDGAFLYVGTIPNTEAFKGLIELDERGYVITDNDTQTNISGIFAAGDVRKKALKQVSTAVGDGATAAFLAEKYIEENW